MCGAFLLKPDLAFDIFLFHRVLNLIPVSRKGNVCMGVKIRSDRERGRLYAFLSGEIDHHSAALVRADIDLNITLSKPTALYLDFSEVTFMDSSGIGLVMGRYKKMQEIGGRTFIQNPPNIIKRVMLLSGVNKLAKIINTDMCGEQGREVKPLEEGAK